MAKKRVEINPPVVVPGVQVKLTDQQMACFEQFSKLKVGALFMKMGTGKTRTALELVRYNSPDLLLYLTPVSTKENIQAEIQKWGCPCPYIIMGYETIASSDAAYMELLEVIKEKEVFIIADESIFIKHGKSKRTERAKELRKHCKWALCLNGTPITKNEWDLYNQMQFLSEKIIPYGSFEFMDKFFTCRIWKDRYRREHKVYTFYEPNRPVLTKLMAPYVFQADLEFDKDEKSSYQWISGNKERYQDAKDEALDIAYEMEDDSWLLRMITSLSYVAATDRNKCKAVAEYIKDRQVICFGTHLDEIELIRKELKGKCFVITGATNAQARKEIIEAFRKRNDKPLVMTLGVGAYSLNLQFCDEIVYSSLTFEFGKLEQSKYRIKRLGQDHDIKYTYILADFKIMNMMYDNLHWKKSLQEIIKELIESGQAEEMKNRRKELKDAS